MNFHNVRMPEFIEVFAIGISEFSTSHVLTKSGREVRSLDRAHANHRYLMKDIHLSNNEFEQFNNFFKARRGSNFAFRFRDHVDYKVTNGFIAKGGEGRSQFYLSKLYDDLIMPYKRIITKPVENSLNVYIDNIPAFHLLDTALGIITLQNTLEENQILTADFIFDVAVRFKYNSFEYTYSNDGSIRLSDLELVEVMV